MIAAGSHPCEAERLAALHRFLLLDTPPEQIFDDLVQVAAQVCGCPISLVSLVDAHRQWFKAKVGLAASETPRDVAFCAHAILQPEQLFEVSDARLDPRFADNPLVTQDPSIRFYAGVPLLVSGGLPIGTLCVIDRIPRTLTPQQRDALQRLGRQVVAGFELRRLIRESAELNLELTRGRDAAVAATREKSAFLANMSHEIRTPLNGIIGMTALLSDSPLNAEQAEQLAMIRLSGDTLLDLINDILDLSKIEAGHLELESLPFDVIDLLDDAAALVVPQCESKGLDLQVITSPTLPAMMLGDPSRLRQIVVNLLSNAKKFTEHGAVILRAERQAERLLITVSDTGIGMSQDVVAKLFQPFTQASSATARQFGGTGLGLTISRHLAEAMGGHLTVQSELGVGSVFTCNLPCAVAAGSRPALDLGGARLAVAPDLRGVLAPWLATWNAAFATDQVMDAAVVDAREPELPLPSVPALLVTPAGGRVPHHHEQFSARLSRPLRIARVGQALHAALLNQSATQPSLTPESRPRQRFTGRILVADDNPINRKVAVAMLTKFGIEVVTAENGAEALAQCAVATFDVILMDCQMPVMDGFAATAELRRIERSATVPRRIVIALTANAMSGDRQLCLAAGMDDYLPKPLRADALGEMLARHLKRLPEALTMTSDPQVSAPSEPDLEPQVIQQLLADLGDPSGAILPELIENFSAQAAIQVTAVRKNLDGGDLIQLGKAAHGLKGQALTLGLRSLAALARELEAGAKAGQVATCAELARTLPEVLARGEQALAKFR